MHRDCHIALLIRLDTVELVHPNHGALMPACSLFCMKELKASLDSCCNGKSFPSIIVNKPPDDYEVPMVVSDQELSDEEDTATNAISGEKAKCTICRRCGKCPCDWIKRHKRHVEIAFDRLQKSNPDAPPAVISFFLLRIYVAMRYKIVGRSNRDAITDCAKEGMSHLSIVTCRACGETPCNWHFHKDEVMRFGQRFREENPGVSHDDVATHMLHHYMAIATVDVGGGDAESVRVVCAKLAIHNFATG